MEFELKKNPELGQVWTPIDCACKMAQMVLDNIHTEGRYRILDPAVGPATFPRAFSLLPHGDNIDFSVFDTDDRMCQYTESFCKDNGIDVKVHHNDFLLADYSEKFDAAIMNPPYIRHEQIIASKKEEYYNQIEKAIGEKIDKRSNLFVLFLFKAMLHLAPGGVMCAIVYDAIKHSRYGVQAMEQLGKHLDLLHDIGVKAPFGDAMIDARIICWKKKNNSSNGVTFLDEKVSHPNNYVTLGNLLNIVRGTALPYRKIFIAQPEDKYYSSAVQILVKQRNPDFFICAEFTRAYIEASTQVQEWLKSRIQSSGHKDGKTFVKPVTGDICFNYYLRNHPRHLLNVEKKPVSDNYYVSSPVDSFPIKAAWLLLNSDLYLKPILAKARNQGDGLLKLQAYEYRSAIVPDWRLLSKESIDKLVMAAENAIKKTMPYEQFRDMASKLAEEVFDE